MIIRTLSQGLVSVLLLITLSGCSGMLVGEWRSIEPANVPPDVPRIRQISLDKDGQFHARLLQHYRMMNVSGTYRFASDNLVLTPDANTEAGELRYAVQMHGDVLVLTQGEQTYRLCREANGSMAGPAPAALRDAVIQPKTEPADVPIPDSLTTQPN